MTDHEQSGHEHDRVFFIDKKPYPIDKISMAGGELKNMAGIPQDYQLWLEVQDGQDVQIPNARAMKLKPGMKFFYAPPTLG